MFESFCFIPVLFKCSLWQPWRSWNTWVWQQSCSLYYKCFPRFDVPVGVLTRLVDCGDTGVWDWIVQYVGLYFCRSYGVLSINLNINKFKYHSNVSSLAPVEECDFILSPLYLKSKFFIEIKQLKRFGGKKKDFSISHHQCFTFLPFDVSCYMLSHYWSIIYKW